MTSTIMSEFKNIWKSNFTISIKTKRHYGNLRNQCSIVCMWNVDVEEKDKNKMMAFEINDTEEF